MVFQTMYQNPGFVFETVSWYGQENRNQTAVKGTQTRLGVSESDTA